MNDADAAGEYFKKSLALDANSCTTQSNYAHLLAQSLNNPDLARVHFDKALAISPNDTAALAKYAAFLLQQGEVARAWELAERSMRLSIAQPNRIMAQPLFCAAAILLLQNKDASIPLGQLKRLFAYGINHVNWVITALLEVLDDQLSPDSGKLMRDISIAINDKSQLKLLEANPLWNAVKPIAFNTEWPVLNSIRKC